MTRSRNGGVRRRSRKRRRRIFAPMTVTDGQCENVNVIYEIGEVWTIVGGSAVLSTGDVEAGVPSLVINKLKLAG